MFKRITEWLALTKTERNVILFLTVTMLIGAGIRLYQRTLPSAPQLDYSASDSTFAILSTTPDERTVAYKTSDIAEHVSGKLNINLATKPQLMDLPGIGEVIAERILRYRKEKGKFVTIEDLRVIKGISKNKLEHLRPIIIIQ